jgi:hypothetical protein
MNIQSSHVILPRTKSVSSATKFMRNAIIVSQRMRYRKRKTHRQVRWTVIRFGDVRIYTQSIVFISYISTRTEKTHESELGPYRTSRSLLKNSVGQNLAVIGSN